MNCGTEAGGLEVEKMKGKSDLWQIKTVDVCAWEWYDIQARKKDLSTITKILKIV